MGILSTHESARGQGINPQRNANVTTMAATFTNDVGPHDGYFVDLTALREEDAFPDIKKSGGGRSSGGIKSGGASSASGPATYLSYHNGVLTRHATWSDCERRVKGQSNTKLKEVKSRHEEADVPRSWGINPQKTID